MQNSIAPFLVLRRLILAALTLLNPKIATVGDAPVILDAISYAVAHDPLPPLFGDRKTDAMVEGYWAWAETGGKMDAKAVGDSGNARCFMQLWNAPDSVMTDPRECASIGLARMHDSAASCPSSPMAPYCGGCDRKGARRLAEKRLRHALYLAGKVQTPPPPEEDGSERFDEDEAADAWDGGSP